VFEHWIHATLVKLIDLNINALSFFSLF